MFGKITMKTRLLIPMLILTVILFVLGGMVIAYSYYHMKSLKDLNQKIILSRYISATLHSLQKERGLSSGVIENRGENFKEYLKEQRKESDAELKKLENWNGEISEEIKKRVLSLAKIRKMVDEKRISSSEVVRFYTKINDYLLSVVVNLSKSSHIPEITENILAYVNFLYLKEYGGLERANGIIILSKKSLNRDSLIKFTNIISVQNQNEKMFLKYANSDIKSYYENSIANNSFKKVKEIQNIIIYKDITKYDINPKDWYEIITDKLNTLDQVGRFIEKEITVLINKELENVNQIYDLVLFLTILSLAVFVMMIISFFRLANEEQRLRLVMNKYIISSITDLQGKIIDVSEAFCKISGYTKEELLGKPHNIVRHPDMPKEAFKELWDTIKKGKTWKGKVKNRTKDGGFYWVYANIEPLYNSKGKVDSYISVRLDITESELLMQKIKEEEEKSRVAKELMFQQSRLAQMGEMLSMIAHQWRQPLSAITAASGALSLKARLGNLDNDKVIEFADKIQGFSQHLSKTIDDFRGFFKTNKLKTNTSFKKIVSDVSNIVKSSIEDASINFVVDIKGSKEFKTYENELKQVVLNLIKNSEDALRDKNIEKPLIYIEAYDNRLCVMDNAGGVPEKIKDKIFDPYFSTKTKKDGTGLGLYMSKTIVEEHCGGKLSVENCDFEDKEGIKHFGAKFKIVLGADDE